MNLTVPLDVPEDMQEEFISNYNALTFKTGKLFIFACDHKIEHLNHDFYGPLISKQANNPEHFFKIASKGHVGALATQLGLIARYGKKYPEINYIVKLNSKTNIIPTSFKDPLSQELWSVEDSFNFKKNSKLNIRGVGYTIYLGSKYEHLMLAQAAKVVNRAHQLGLVAILWIYPRSQYIEDERDGSLIAGACGVANSLSADFVKVQVPRGNISESSIKQLQIATQAAGNTKVICAGGEFQNKEKLLSQISDQINLGGTFGIAIGRNIFQRSEEDAIILTRNVSYIVYGQIFDNNIKYQF